MKNTPLELVHFGLKTYRQISKLVIHKIIDKSKMSEIREKYFPKNDEISQIENDNFIQKVQNFMGTQMK
jgi:hypothetical protein